MDLELATREATRTAEDWLRRLDELRVQAEQVERELARALEQEARAKVAAYVQPAQRDAAERLVSRGVRVADEVGAWLWGRSPLGLAQRLLPELRGAAGDLKEFIDIGGWPPPASPPAPANVAP
jgi:hypothetical protein